MKKSEYKEKIHELLEELKEHISNLEKKAGEIADDAKKEYHEQLNNLKDIRDNLAIKLEEYENISETKWDVVSEAAADFCASVSEAWRKNYNKAVEAFKKE